MYKRIMVAIDDSAQSKYVLREAIKLTKKHRAKLMIVNVADEYLDTQVGPFILPEEYDRAMREFGVKILQRAKKTAEKSGVKAETKLVETHSIGHQISEIIIDAAKKWRANLLVVGTHGRRGFHRFLLGSVAEGITRISPIPVLLLRKEK